MLEAIEEAEVEGDRKLATRLTDLLEARKTVQALAVIDGATTVKKKAVVVDVPRTLHDHANTAFSEFYEAACKARVPAELEVLAAMVERMSEAVQAARARVKGS